MHRHGAIIVHGGAGNLGAGEVDGARAGCEEAARRGFEILRSGGRALDAVEAAVRVLEDDDRFNAGRGASLNVEGNVELEASIMRGENLSAGAVALVAGVRHPIALARCVMEDGEHLFVAGAGALAYARQYGLELVPADFHVTAKARAELAEALARRAAEGPARREGEGGGTVGAVAIDSGGHVAAATSTGGMTGKRLGRIGDVPAIGCGTYADDRAGGASSTGHGERIAQVVLAKAVVDRMRAGQPAAQATAEGIAELGERVRGEAGIIAVDARGRVGFARNTRTMAFAFVLDGADAVSGV